MLFASSRSVLFAAIIILASTFCFPQTRDSATLTGFITDASSAPVAGAHVILTNATTAARRETVTASTGTFEMAGLPLTGSWTLQISHTGFAPIAIEHLQLRAGTAARVDIRLQPAGKPERVDVFGTADTVRTDTAEIGSTFALRKIEETPVLNRRLTTMPLLDSSVRPARGTGDLFLNNTLWVINGSGRRQTAFSVDNSTGDDSWGRQTLFTTIPFSVVQEFTVLTNPVSAEYGRTGGSAINIVTKSGSNQWHGDVLGLWRPGSLGARAPLAITDTNDTLGQSSGTISGPLIHDRTHVLFSTEYSRQSRDSVITSTLAPGLYTGHFRQALLFGRLDQRLNDHHSLFLRFDSDRFSDSNPQDAVGGNNLPSSARYFRRRTYSAQLSETAAFARFVNEARFQYQLGSPITQFEPVSPSTQFVRAGVSTEGESRRADLLNHQYQWADTVIFSTRRHTIKSGADIIYSRSGGYGQEFGGGFVLGQFRVKPGVTAPLSQLTINDVSQFTQSFGDLTYRVDETIWGIFLQDDWTPRRDLTLNLGARYERQSYSDDNNNIAPRMGLAYKLPFSHPTVLRASFGVYYSELRANLGANFELNGPQGILSFTVAPGETGFPTSLAPLPAFPAGAILPARDIQVRPGTAAYLNQFFDVSQLPYFPSHLLNPYTQQWSLGLESELARGWILSLDYLGQHTINIDRPVDLNAPSPFPRNAPGQTRSAAAADATRPVVPISNGFRRIIATVNNGEAFYDGLQVRLRKRLSTRFTADLSYTLSHTINTVETDTPQQDPNEQSLLGTAEGSSSLLDQRHRLVLSGAYSLPFQFSAGLWTTLASGRPYNITTGVDNNGDGSTSDRPFVDGRILGRNAGQGTPTYDISTFLEKTFQVNERFNFHLRAEAFNLFNHSNIVGRNGTYGNSATGIPSSTLGAPLGGISNTDPGRAFQFTVRLAF
jgi:carboxypeptidase family protein